MKFPIPFLPWVGRASLEVEIPDNTAEVWRLKVALEVAVKSGASLVGASLVGASLDGASLVGASLDHASLDGARLDGARLVGARIDTREIAAVIAIVPRIIGGYVFNAFLAKTGEVFIVAGCHGPWSVERYRRHVAEQYPGTPKAEETLAILDYIEARAKAHVVKAAE